MQLRRRNLARCLFHDQDYVLFGLFFVAFGVRISGIGFGLPNLLCRPDEYHIIMIALKFFRGDLNPHFFNYPTFYMYFIFLIYVGYVFIFWISGHSLSEFLVEIATSPANFFLFARGVSAFLGSLTIFPVYYITLDLTRSKQSARLSAAFMSLLYLHVRDAHFATTDVTMTCWIAWAVWFLLQAYTNLQYRVLIFAGIFTGLSIATKYAGIFLIIPMVTVELIRIGAVQSPLASFRHLVRRTHAYLPHVCFSKRLWLFTGVSIGVFFVWSPFVFLDIRTFWHDVMFEFAHVTQAQGVNSLRGWGYHLRYTLPYSMGWPFFLIALVGSILSFMRDPRQSSIILSFPLFYFIIAGKGLTVFVRYMIPMLPFFCVLGAFCVSEFARMIPPHLWRKPLLIILTIVVIWPSVKNVYQYNRLLSQKDTRVIAAEWIIEHLPDKSYIYRTGTLFGQVQFPYAIEALTTNYKKIVQQGGSGVLVDIQIKAALNTPDYKGFFDWEYSIKNVMSGNLPDYIILQKSPLLGRDSVPDGIERLIDEQYCLIKTFEAGNIRHKENWYDQMDTFYLPFHGFYEIERPGPNLHIYRRV
ncbi:hypothetical protein U14_03157 [Candidatus Moduliflexus flocculans]|uniref:ArnT-like N-terminal domain-containing protein n=1 Tax=Candidatus Moduliflexus flocculans TaxID=1499966 RepID=A0A081BNE5_9BACT|nr:hypothetical protein U14_03157 [Candidatus Moduliflexus flocculans]